LHSAFEHDRLTVLFVHSASFVYQQTVTQLQMFVCVGF
jgi:hypothetical protein